MRRPDGHGGHAGPLLRPRPSVPLPPLRISAMVRARLRHGSRRCCSMPAALPARAMPCCCWARPGRASRTFVLRLHADRVGAWWPTTRSPLERRAGELRRPRRRRRCRPAGGARPRHPAGLPLRPRRRRCAWPSSWCRARTCRACRSRRAGGRRRGAAGGRPARARRLRAAPTARAGAGRRHSAAARLAAGAFAVNARRRRLATPAAWCWSPACRAPARPPSCARWRISATRRWTTRRSTVLDGAGRGRRRRAAGRSASTPARAASTPARCWRSWRGCAACPDIARHPGLRHGRGGRAAAPLHRNAAPPPAGARAGRSAAGWPTASPRERTLIAPLRDAADLVIDTSDLPLPELRQLIEHRFAPRTRPPRPVGVGDVLRASRRACRGRPTWSSTCASCATRTTTPRCGRGPGSTPRSPPMSRTTPISPLSGSA